MRAYGSPNWMMNQDLCGGCRALSDRITGLAITYGEDIDNTNCALIVGRNPSAADAAQSPALTRAKARGAAILPIAPATPPAATLAAMWLSPRTAPDAARPLARLRRLTEA